MADFIYDIETYPNAFTCTVKRAGEPEWWQFEISAYRDMTEHLLQFLEALRANGHRMVGFNNIGFDYPVLHRLIGERCGPFALYEVATKIIKSEDRFGHIIWDKDQYVEQVDLYRIHHFDNRAKSTSLKALEFAMRMDDLRDLPFAPGKYLQEDQVATLLQYNAHDVEATDQFYQDSMPSLRLREELTAKYGHRFINANDTKIGKDYFMMMLGKGGKTPRPTIALGDVILPMVRFESPEFERVRNWISEQVITETKGLFDGLVATIDGFKFSFGLGGIHGSVDRRYVESDADHVVLDYDVTSYYPSLAIVNRLYPEHLGEGFCDIYAEVKRQRMTHPKGSPENMMLKLALNGVYGDSNNKYGPFYDPKYTMAITINGQLLLCMLAERVMREAELIQINTDGMTVRCRRDRVDRVESVCRWWQDLTGLELERAEYSRMWVRDVNNYLAETTTGKVKRKGVYEYKLGWHQNHSALVVPKAAERVLLDGADPERTVREWPDRHDFMLFAKGPRLEIGVEQVQSRCRYYISHLGSPLTKIMPPLKGKTEDRRIGINVGYRVREANVMPDEIPFDMDYGWYIGEVRKLVTYDR